MEKKQFKTESKKMLDMMINSVYTHKEIFLRELISNASDAIDKRYFQALTRNEWSLPRAEYAIKIAADSENRTLTITDNGCGMTAEELENNLGTIAKSGSGEFKLENGDDDIDIIGQFGVGFYSAFMVSDKITVKSRALGADEAYVWESEGVEGYTIEPCEYDEYGTEIVLHIKEDTENERYGEFLEEFPLRDLVKKYSDYIRYPILMDVERQREIKKDNDEADQDGENKEPEYETYTTTETLNSMVPLWHKPASEVTEEQYKDFYSSHFYDYTAPLKTIHSHIEGTVDYEMLLFIPGKAPHDYYTKAYEKGLQLYADGVMIMEKCPDMLPDYFNFVRGIVDSSDFTLNISRETLQHNHQVKAIAKSIEKKIKSELLKMQDKDRAKYREFFEQFGVQLKYGIYLDYGEHKDFLQDLLLFCSTKQSALADADKDESEKTGDACGDFAEECSCGHDDKHDDEHCCCHDHEDEKYAYVTLKEYVEAMPEDQKAIYYCCAETTDLAAAMPRTAMVCGKGYEVLLLTDEVDEFAIKVVDSYQEKRFVNINTADLDIATDEEKDTLKEENEAYKELLSYMQEVLEGEVKTVRFSNTMQEHPVCLTSEGYMSADMAKVLSQMPGNESFAHVDMALEINLDHPVAKTLKTAFVTDKDKVARYTKILYAQARQISGLEIKDPVKLSEMICDLLV